MKNLLIILWLGFSITSLFSAPQSETKTLVLYSGRGESLVGPLVERFKAQTGIEVQVRYAGTPELTRLILEEGDRSPADVFWAQDVASLGTLHRANRFQNLPTNWYQKLLPSFQYSVPTWIPISGRARILYYNPQKVTVPADGFAMEDLVQPAYRGRVGWALSNASFQLSVAALVQQWGRNRTLQWLRAMKANGAKNFANNMALLDGIAAGEIDLALSNHYYLPRTLVSRPNLPIASTTFKNQDAGNLLNVSGVGILTTAKNLQSARRFVEFLLSEEAQRYFVEQTFEYTVIANVGQPTAAPNIDSYRQIAPKFDLNQLDLIDEVQALLREAELL